MEITSAKFIKGVVGPDDILDNQIPQIAFVGRSNAGKSKQAGDCEQNTRSHPRDQRIFGQ